MNKKSSASSDVKMFDEIKAALSHIHWGSIEIFIQDSKVVQITERNIKKLSEKK